MASSSGNSSVSCTHGITVQRISHNWTLPTGLGSSLYSLDMDPTENTVSEQSCSCCYGWLPSDSLGIISTGTCLLSHCSETAIYLPTA
jgi:hypothetical protein